MSNNDESNVHNVLNRVFNSLHNHRYVNAAHPYPCNICHKNVNYNQKGLQCHVCDKWTHITCNNTNIDEYNTLKANSTHTHNRFKPLNCNWLCNICTTITRAEVFPFGLVDNYDLQNLLETDSLEILNLLPAYEIASKTKSFVLNDSDIDENMIDNINSQYHSVKDFKSIIQSNALFSILHTNLNGLENKFDIFSHFIQTTQNNIDLICLTETTQKADSNFNMNVNLNGYKSPFILGSYSARGGVAIYAKENLNVIERNDLTKLSTSYESIWIEIVNKKSKNVICNCTYRHPNADLDEFITYMNQCIDQVNKEKKDCYISGDFNIDLIKTDSNVKYNEFICMMAAQGFLPHILQPSRITEHSSTLIDNIYGNCINHDSTSGNILLQFADHLCQFLTLNKPPDKSKPKKAVRRDYSNFNENAFLEDVSIQNWNALNLLGTDNKFNDFIWRLEACVDRHAPLKKLSTTQRKRNDNPWINNHIIRLISRKNDLFTQLKDAPTNYMIKRSYILFRNRVTREIKKAKKEYYKQFFIKNLNNIKSTWKGIKDIINVNSNHNDHINQIKHNGNLIDDDEKIANTFNNFFTKIGPQLDKDIPQHLRPNGHKYYLKNRVPNSFLISPTTPDEIINLIDALDESKSPGPCPIPIRLLKISKELIAIPLSNICNLSFNEGIFPSKNKIAKVIPIFKKGLREDINNYRPISLLSVFSKIMEKLMASRLNSFLELHHIIYPKQFGFRAGHSTSHALIDITETIRKSMEERKYACGVFLDLSKAFDTVNNKILLSKLEHYGIRDKALLWFETYLANRKQYVHINGIDSSTLDISCGVPQGSVLGPLLFLIYVNDLPNIFKKAEILFVC